MVSALTNLLLPVILVRMLGPEEIGIYKIFFLYAQSITFLSLAGGPLFSVYYWVGKKENANQFLESAWLLSFILSLTTALIGFLFVGQVSHLISINKTHTLLLLSSAISAAPAAFYGEYMIAKGKRIQGSLFNSGFEILKACVIISLVIITKHIDAAFWGYGLLYLFKLLLAVRLCRKEKIIQFKLNFQIIREVWKYCAPLSIAGALSFFLEKVDLILLSSQLNPIHFAYYSMGCLAIPPLYLLEMSVSKVLIPALSSAYHHDRKKEMVIHYRKAQSDIAYLMIPAVFGLIIFSRPIIETLFTKAYMDSAVFLKVYAFTYLVYIIPHDAIPRASGHSNWVLKIYLLLTPLSLIVVYFFAGKYGAMGALVSSMVFMFLPKIPGLMFSAEITGEKIYKLIAWKALGFYTLINCALALLTYSLKPFFLTEKIWFFTIAPLYAVVYLIVVNTVKYFKTKYEEKLCNINLEVSGPF